VPKHITIGLFETSKTFKQTLKKKILVYVKDIEGSNLNIMITIINSMVNYKTLGVMESF
jgi:hypothetical protein